MINSDMGSEKIKVLVIDDEPDLRRVMRTMLERNGFYVEEAKNGEDGLEKIQNQSFDHIFVDLRMPKMDGVSFIKKLKSKRTDARIYIITAHINYDLDEEKLINSYIEGFAMKPFVEKELLELMKFEKKVILET